jgi:hypothetical protein
MKYKFLFICALAAVCVVNSFAQERNFEIGIALEETSIAKKSDEVPVTVKITNRAEETLKTEGLDPLNFYFSNCSTAAICFAPGDIYRASYRIPAEKLRENGSFEFEVDLAALTWFDRTDKAENSIAFAQIPSENIYFFADVKLFKGFRELKGVSKKAPEYRIFRSNGITVVLE